jgi:hypothetical protein
MGLRIDAALAGRQAGITLANDLLPLIAAFENCAATG